MITEPKKRAGHIDDHITIKQHQQELNALIRQHQNEINCIMSSRSWRLTAPMRKVGEVFRRISGLLKMELQNTKRSMLHLMKCKKQNYNLIIVDDYFPIPHANTWRSTEYHEFFEKIPNTVCLNISDDFKNKYICGIPEEKFEERLKSYLKYKPENKRFVRRLDLHTKYKANLAYLLFFNNISLMLPWLEKNKLPFVFTLYPGGGFCPDIKERDRELKEIFSSPMFQEVIVTQNFTKDYLVKNNLCPKHKINLIFGCLSQHNEQDVLVKQFYPKDKMTFDVSFVGHQYTEKGIRKGFDIFIKVADKLSKSHNDMHFHIVGNWDKEIEPYLQNKKIHYYAERPSEFFPKFYSKIDISLSPSRSHRELKKLFPKDTPLEFDGFPLALDAGLSSVALCVTDELDHTKEFFEDGKNIILINHNVEDICEKLEFYYKNTDELYKISEKQTVIFKQLFNTKTQINQRLQVLNKYLKNQL